MADALFDLYVEDGWDDEALALAVTHYGYDPNPLWIDKLGRLSSPVAKAQIKAWKKLDKDDKRTVLAEAALRLIKLGGAGRRKKK